MSGLTFVPDSGGVVSLNYYDGRFLRADDLNLERSSQREYAELANRATASGVVWGFDLSAPKAGTLRLSAGLARTPRGKVLYLPDGVTPSVADLLKADPATGPAPGGATGFAACATPAAASGSTAAPGTALYLVCLTPASILQGTGEVFGRVCSGCGPAVDSPYLADGVTLLVRPLTVDLQPYTMAGVTRPDTHLRSQVASAYFAAERAAAGRLSAQLLRSSLWSAGALSQAGDDAVAIGVLGWNGTQITLLDRWTARRETIGTPPSGYWAGQLEQRPEPVFLAQVLQFQDQLSAAPAAPGGSVQALIDRGVVELPAAGYHPVNPSVDLRDQLGAQFGPGVRLWLCAVRRDQIPHELERARHMDRISLLRGLRDETAREQVDILVPDGLISTAQGGLGFALDVALGQDVGAALDPAEENPRGTARGLGAGRLEPGPGFTARAAVAVSLPRAAEALARWLRGDEAGLAGLASFLSATQAAPAVDVPAPTQLQGLVDLVQAARASKRGRRAQGAANVRTGALRVAAAAAVLTVDADPFALADQQSTAFRLEVDVYQPSASATVFSLWLSGTLTRRSAGQGETTVLASGGFGVSATGSDGGGGTFKDRRLRLARTAQDGVTATVRDEDSGLVADLHWKGEPIQAEAALRLDAGQTAAPTTIAALTAAQDAGIGRPGNTYHDAAASALALLAGIHPDPGWAEQEYQRLFPSRELATATVRATQDWVLFRRRRREDCEGDPVTPVPLDTVTVQVLSLPGPDDAQKAVDILVDGDAQEWPAGWKATEVIFEGGTTTMLTPAATWQQRYRDRGGADAVALAGYAAAAGTLGPIVGPGRLRSLLAALPPGVTQDPALPVIPVAPPTALEPAPGTAGSAFLITYAPKPEAVRLLAVRAVRTVAANQAAVEGVRKPDAALATEVAPFSTLGEGGTGTLKTGDVLAELDVLLDTEELTLIDVETVLWTHASLTADETQEMEALAGTMETALAGRPEVHALTKGSRLQVGYPRTDPEPVARLFLLVSATSPMN
jgi:hypothetical protein